MAGEVGGAGGAHQKPQKADHPHDETPRLGRTARDAFKDGNLTDDEVNAIVASIHARGGPADTLTRGELRKIDRALQRMMNHGTITADQANAMRTTLYARLQADVEQNTLQADDKVKARLAAPRALEVKQDHQHTHTDHTGKDANKAPEHQ